MNLPRTYSFLTTQQVGDELLVAGPIQKEAYCLRGDLARAWPLFKGEKSFQEALREMSSEQLMGAWREFERLGLLVDPRTTERENLEKDLASKQGLSRRDFLTRGAMAGLVIAVAIPAPAAAASGCLSNCDSLSNSPNGECGCACCLTTIPGNHLNSSQCATTNCPGGCATCQCFVIKVRQAAGSCATDPLNPGFDRYCIHPVDIATIFQTDCATARSFASVGGPYACCTNCL